MTGSNTVLIADNHIPEEIFHASGLGTLRLSHTLRGITASGSSYLPSQSCLYCRTAAQQLSDYQHQATGAVFTSSCTAMEKLYEVFFRKSDLTFVEMIDLPKVHNERGVEFFRRRLDDLIVRLEKEHGLGVDQRTLHEAIKLNNGLRAVLREKRKCRSQFLKNKPLSLEVIRETIKQVEDGEETRSDKRSRVLVMGTRLQEDVVSRVVSEEGGDVAMFLTDDGNYYNDIRVEEDSEDPVGALAGAYLDTASRRRTIERLPDMEMIKEIIDRENIDGVVTLSYPYCAKMVYDTAWLRKNREYFGVPLLNVQIEDVSVISAGLKSRIGAFIEMIGVN